MTSLVAWGLHSLTRNVMLKPMVCLIVTALGVATQIAESVAANAEWDRSVLPRPSQPFQGIAKRTLEGSEAAFTQPVKAPPDAPNILLVLIDDAGFGNPSTFGGPVATPTLDKLAAGGLRYNRFHVTALCSPTRAAFAVGPEPRGNLIPKHSGDSHQASGTPIRIRASCIISTKISCG